MNKYNVTGDEIVALLARSESDDMILDLFEKLEIDRSEIERDEDIDSFDIDLEEEIGLVLTFDSSLEEKYCVPKYIGGNYLVQVTFDYYFKPLPYNLDDAYDLDAIVNVLNKEPNYININDASRLYWFYEDLGWFTIEFEDESLSSIYSVDVKPYENPLDAWESTKDEEGVSKRDGFSEIIKPYKR